MDKRTADAAGAWGADERLPGGRLAIAGAQGADAITWISRVSVAALAVAVLWWVWVIVRPLPAADAEQVAALPVIPTLSAPTADDARRAELVESLGRENLYSADRRPWVRLPMASAPGESTSSATADAKPAAGSEAAGPGAAIAGDPGSIAFTPTERLPEDVRKALSTLELKAVRAESTGAGVAMISFVHSPTRQLSTAYRKGDEFKDEANPGASWRVEAVDLKRRRVLLRRAGVVAALPLYKGLGEGPAVGVSGDDESALTIAGIKVEGRTRDEVIIDLRAQGLSETDIQAVIDELDRQLADSGDSPVKVLGDLVATPEEDAADGEARRTPPAGMEAVLQMMATQSKETTEKTERPEQRRRGRSPPGRNRP